LNNEQLNTNMAHHNASRDPDKDPGTDTVITSHSKIPLSLVYFLIVLAIGGALAWADLKADIRDVKKHMKDDWTMTEQRELEYQFAALNPTSGVRFPSSTKVFETTHP
jgi:hypothetical protein